MFSTQTFIAHRGAAGYAPENTLSALKKAYELGCRLVEFDVVLSADGEPFIFHDQNLKRTTNGQGDIGLVTSEYLASLDAGSWFSKEYIGEKIPSLREVLLWLSEHDMQANIEIKPYPGRTEQTVVSLLNHIHRFWPKLKPLPFVSSFDIEALKLSRMIMPELPLCVAFHAWDDHWLKIASDLNCLAVHLNKQCVTQKRIDEIKIKGYAVCVYTVNNKRLATKLLKWGVDALFTDYPDLLSRPWFHWFKTIGR